MKRWIPLVMVGMLAACAPGPLESAPLEPLAPETTVPEMGEPEVIVPMTPETMTPDTTMEPEMEPEVEVITPETAEPETLPEEPTITVIPAEPEGDVAAEAAGAMSGGSLATDPEDTGIDATISISADNQSFISATDEDQNPVTVAAGGTFYLRVSASDPDGITGVAAELRNSDDAGPLPAGPFAVASSDCEAQVAAVPTELTCTVAVTIALGTQNIVQEGETAYAFRPLITDALGSSDLAYSWGYLIVQ